MSAPAQEGAASLLFQESQNPNVYTKLSCFLPWIAEQYNMEYESPGITEEECEAGTGNKDDMQELENADVLVQLKVCADFLST